MYVCMYVGLCIVLKSIRACLYKTRKVNYRTAYGQEESYRNIV